MIENRRSEFIADLCNLFTKYKADIPQGDYTIDTILYGIIDVLKHEVNIETDRLVRQCLLGCIKGLNEAAFDYYASTK